MFIREGTEWCRIKVNYVKMNAFPKMHEHMFDLTTETQSSLEKHSQPPL